MSLWALNTLSIWQTTELIVASWPYQGFIPMLVELSPFLVPNDAPLLSINPDVCPEAAQAAALAEQLGYTGASGFVQQRCTALEHQLELLEQEYQLWSQEGAPTGQGA